MALILQQKEKKDPLDYLMQGLTIASQVYGIKANRAALDEHETKMKALPAQQAQAATEEMRAQAKFDLDQRRGEAELAKRPQFPTRLVETVDAQGSPAQRIVEDRPGQTFIKPPSLPGEQLEKVLSPGEKKRDQDFAADYNDFIARGGFSDVASDLKELKRVSATLEKETELTGPVRGSLPDFVRYATNPEAINMREGVRNTAQKNLKLILGGQFSEKEGEQLLKRAFDDRASVTENKRRVDRLIEQIQGRANQMVSASDYFEKNRTLKGFTGTGAASSAIAGAQQVPAPKSEQGTAQAAPKAEEQVINGYRYRKVNGGWQLIEE